MRMIRYSKMVIGSRDQCGTLELSNYDDCHHKQETTCQLAEKMLKKANAWIIDGEPFKQISALYELIEYIREKGDHTFIHIKSHIYDYSVLRSTSTTDEILDMCDVLTDKNGVPMDLRTMSGGSEFVYLEVSDD